MKKFIKKLYVPPRIKSNKEKSIKSQTQKLPQLSGKVAWLIPDQPAYQAYSEAIETFANLYEAPLFTPHITFGSLPNLPVEQLSLALDPVFVNRAPLELEADFVRCSSSPFQNLVHQYKLNNQFNLISQQTETELPGFQAKDEIHISLMYGYIECERIKELSDKAEKNLPKNVRISEYQIIGLADRVEDWKTLYRKSL